MRLHHCASFRAGVAGEERPSADRSPRISILNLPHRYTGKNVHLGGGTLFDTGGTVRRYATIAFEIVGRQRRERRPVHRDRAAAACRLCRMPRVIARLISSSVQLPRPVSLSDVRLPVGKSPNGTMRMQHPAGQAHAGQHALLLVERRMAERAAERVDERRAALHRIGLRFSVLRARETPRLRVRVIDHTGLRPSETT